jgi:hypothetical protein
MSNPSLILPQSPAYGEDYVYAAQVEDGAVPLYNVLPLTFTRASGGTRINKDGLVQNMPYNLIEQSETFNTTWGALNLTVTANTTTAPNGTTTADTFTLTASVDSSVYQAVNGESNNYTISVYAKYVSGDKYLYFFSPLNSQGEKVWFDIQNGTVSNQLSGFTGTIEDAGNGWYKCSMYNTTAAVLDYLQMGISTTNSSRTLSNNSVSYFWGAQVNLGTAQPYLATTDRLNMPRITYPVGGGCGALLLEKQSTNLLTYSEQFDNASWLKGSNVAVTANSIVSPDGTQNADTATNSGANSVYIYQLSQAQGTTWTTSLYAKKGTNKYLGIAITAYSYVNERYQPVFNLDDGTIQAQNTSGTNVSNTSCSITPVGNGWYRITATGTFVAGADYCYAVIQSSNNTNYQPDTATGSLDWANATNGNAYLWGAQMEASSYPTSYISTTSSSVTRIADACYKTGISNLIGQTEGVIFVDYVLNGQTNSANIFNCEKNTTCSLFMAQQLDGNFDAGLYVSGSLVGRIEAGSISIGQRVKVAYAYKSGSFALYINGVQEGILSSTFTFPTTLDDIFLNDETYFNYKEAVQYNQVSLYKTRLSNAELATLTTI